MLRRCFWISELVNCDTIDFRPIGTGSDKRQDVLTAISILGFFFFFVALEILLT
jgi:hypothetical protein